LRPSHLQCLPLRSSLPILFALLTLKSTSWFQLKDDFLQDVFLDTCQVTCPCCVVFSSSPRTWLGYLEASCCDCKCFRQGLDCSPPPPSPCHLVLCPLQIPVILG
jgi:hypothetical protein